MVCRGKDRGLHRLQIVFIEYRMCYRDTSKYEREERMREKGRGGVERLQGGYREVTKEKGRHTSIAFGLHFRVSG